MNPHCGSLASRVANKLVDQILSRCDYAVDLHAGARHRTNLPQIRVDLDNPDPRPSARPSACRSCCIRGCGTAHCGKKRPTGKSRSCCTKAAKACDSMNFPSAWACAASWMSCDLGMLRRSRRKKPMPEPLITRRTTWVRATTSGVLRSLASLGSKVTEGDLLGIIGDPMGNEETGIYAHEDGIVIGRLNLSLVSEGDALFHIACYREMTDHAEQAISDLQEEIGVADYEQSL